MGDVRKLIGFKNSGRDAYQAAISCNNGLDRSSHLIKLEFFRVPTKYRTGILQQAAPFIVLEHLEHCSGTVFNRLNIGKQFLAIGTLINRGNTFRHIEATRQFCLLLL